MFKNRIILAASIENLTESGLNKRSVTISHKTCLKVEAAGSLQGRLIQSLNSDIRDSGSFRLNAQFSSMCCLSSSRSFPHCSKVAAATPDIKLVTMFKGRKGNVSLFIGEENFTELHQQTSPQVHGPRLPGSHANALAARKLGNYLSDI